MGRAMFGIRHSDSLERGPVQYFLGLEREKLYLVFNGFLMDAHWQQSHHLQITARSLSMALEKEVCLDLQHVIPSDILKQIAQQCGVTFRLPENASYLSEIQPYFYFHGHARYALAHMFRLWNIQAHLWTQFDDGSIYWGSWLDSPFNQKPLFLDPLIIKERQTQAQSFVLPSLPHLRPGHWIHCDFPFMVKSVFFERSHTVVSW